VNWIIVPITLQDKNRRPAFGFGIVLHHDRVADSINDIVEKDFVRRQLAKSMQGDFYVA
jgi:hypothetical protein